MIYLKTPAIRILNTKRSKSPLLYIGHVLSWLTVVMTAFITTGGVVFLTVIQVHHPLAIALVQAEAPVRIAAWLAAIVPWWALAAIMIQRDRER